MQEKELCPVCQHAGLIKYLKSYQINLEEAVVLCENKLCTYPLSLNSSATPTFSRKFDDVLSSTSNEVRAKVLDSQLALQTKMTSHMRQTGLHLQKDAIGIQTGSPQLKKKKKMKQAVSNKKRDVTAALFSQNGLDTYPPYQLQNGSQSFQNFKSFTERNRNTPGAMGQTGCFGSDNFSDRDLILNSSGESLESSSTTSSNNSVSESINFSYIESNSYQAFKFKGKTEHLPNSLVPGLNSIHNGHSKQINDTTSSDEVINDGHKALAMKAHDLVQERTLYTEENTGRICENRNVKIDQESQFQIEDSLYEVQKRLNNEIEKQGNFKSSVSKLIPIQDKTTVESHVELLRYPSIFPQWRNKDALCWLDVILCLAVHNETLKSLVFSDSFDKKNLIYKLFTAHTQACKLIQSSESKPVLQEFEISSEPSQTKDIDKCSNASLNNQAQQSNELSKENSPKTHRSKSACLENSKAEELLNEVREEVWTKLRIKLKCEKGQNESPVFAFPLLLKESPAVENMFKMVYRFDYKCSKCGTSESSDHVNTLPTFPRVVKEFNINDPKHSKKCPQCGNASENRNMVYKNLPECLLMHFIDGLPETSWEELQFGFHGYIYTVTGVVQYMNNPDHFIAWLRNPQDNKWFKCDDLLPTICQKWLKEPNFSHNQIHIIMWERLKMRSKICRQVAIDTDDVLQPEKQTLEKKTQLNFDLATEPEIDNKHSNLVEIPSINILKHINNGNYDSTSKSDKNSVRYSDASPCSTRSTASSDTLHLPNFVAFTESNQGVLRPIPKPVVSLIPITCNRIDYIKGNTQPKGYAENTVVQGYPEKYQGLALEGKTAVDKLKVTLEKRITMNNSNDQNEKTVDGNKLSMPHSQISGPKTIIKPSTVFCVPKKSSEFDVNGLGEDLKPGCSTEDLKGTDKVACKQGETTVHCSSVVNVGDTSNNSETRKRKFSGTSEKTVINTKLHSDNKLKDKEQCEINIVKKLALNKDTEKTEIVQVQKKKICEISRFKKPFKMNIKPHLSRDAFFTLETDSSTPGSSGASTPTSSISSPALSGNLTYLNSVKQYLISRTSGRAEPKLKFEGLNLKTSSSNGSFDSSDLGLFVSSYASNNASGLQAEHSTPSDSFDSQSISDSSSHSSISRKSVLVNKLIQKLEQNPVTGKLNLSTLKRRLDMNAKKSPKKRFQGSETEHALSSENTSLKENARIHHQKKVSGGKSMKLVRKLANKAEKAGIQHTGGKTNDGSVELNNQLLNSKVAKCDSESVLQDLYEALNIPFSNVDATMTDIMADVDDILGFVNVDDLVPDQHHTNRPPSCFEGSSAENKKHFDCWLGGGDRNYSQREMSFFRITHLFLK